jgi:hypothetical protein
MRGGSRWLFRIWEDGWAARESGVSCKGDVLCLCAGVRGLGRLGFGVCYGCASTIAMAVLYFRMNKTFLHSPFLLSLTYHVPPTVAILIVVPEIIIITHNDQA